MAYWLDGRLVESCASGIVLIGWILCIAILLVGWRARAEIVGWYLGE